MHRCGRLGDRGDLLLHPALVILLGAVGLSAWLAWLDFVLLPALVIFLGITAYALVRMHRARAARSAAR